MRVVVLRSALALSAIAASLSALPAHAQYLAIPVSNGSFALSGNGGGTEYSAPLTLLSPAGTINLTNYPLPGAAISPTITTNTPIGLYFSNVSGSATLTDGRSATFPAGEGYLKLESLATATGAPSSDYLPTAAGVTVSFSVQAGSLVVPSSTVSAYPTPQFSIPITGGSLSINAGSAAQPDTVTIASVLTPLGTANLTLTFPDITQTNSSDAFVTSTGQAWLIHGVANGSVALSDGSVATVSDRIVTLTATGRLTQGASIWYGEEIPSLPTIFEASITSGSLSVPASAVALPTASTPPVQPPLAGEPPTPPITPPSPPTAVIRPEPVLVNTQPQPQTTPISLTPTPTQPELQLGFATSVNLGGEPNEFTTTRSEPVVAVEISEVDRSSLESSRIHPAVNMFSQ
ncbi:MAG: hypothetical protein IGS48_10800 [Oscillatoriales cyanobacterium C42_A2020_001]|nr:hypothetical protein [Leptolyngbyaceae cyanobacterium C42_A2020_001]